MLETTGSVESKQYLKVHKHTAVEKLKFLEIKLDDKHQNLGLGEARCLPG